MNDRIRHPGAELARVDRALDDSHIRCRGCGGLKVYDLGPGIFGEPQVDERCPRCDLPPSTWDTLPRDAS